LSYRLRLLLATTLVLGMICAAAYVNLSRNTERDLLNFSATNFIGQIIYNSSKRNFLHIIGFSVVGFLLGRWTDQQGSKALAYRYAILGGLGIELIQLLTTREAITWRRPFISAGDILLNTVGISIGLLMLHWWNKRKIKTVSRI
jgi:glycopeptide antibiotics resistance protein